MNNIEKIEKVYGIRVLKIFCVCEVEEVYEKISNWLRIDSGLVEYDDYTMRTEVDFISVKFYDQTCDYIGNTPVGFETMFMLKWS